MKTSVNSVIFHWFPVAYEFFFAQYINFFLLVLLEQEEETLTWITCINKILNN